MLTFRSTVLLVTAIVLLGGAVAAVARFLGDGAGTPRPEALVARWVVAPVAPTSKTLEVLVALGGCRSLGTLAASETDTSVILNVRYEPVDREALCTADWGFTRATVVLDNPVGARPVGGAGKCAEPSPGDCRSLFRRLEAG